MSNSGFFWTLIRRTSTPPITSSKPMILWAFLFLRQLQLSNPLSIISSVGRLPPSRQRRLSAFCETDSARAFGSHSKPGNFILNRCIIPASDALTKSLCSACSRLKVRQCIPLGLSPSPFRMPASQPSRSLILSARRAARASRVSR